MSSERVAAIKSSKSVSVASRKLSVEYGEHSRAGSVGAASPGVISTSADTSVQLASVVTMRGYDASKTAEATSISNYGKHFLDSGSGESSSDTMKLESTITQGARYTHATASHSNRVTRTPTVATTHDIQFTSVNWINPVMVCKSTHHINGYQRSVSLISNSQSILPFLERPVLKAAHMFQSRAYLHQYSRFGISENDFEEAFLSLGQVIQNYRSLSHI